MNAPDLKTFDVIVVNSSAGKDSQAMLDLVIEQATVAGVLDRVVVVHADLGQVEWNGTRELAQEQAAHYGVRFEVVRREKGDLLAQVEARGKWPDRGNRYCTSDQKRDQVAKLFTALAAERRVAGVTGRATRILNCMGLRAAESPARQKLDPLELDARASNGRREVWSWLPVHAWSLEQVWARIKASGVRHHPAYDMGMPRLSCCFCVFSSRSALLLDLDVLGEQLGILLASEKKIGHRFTHKLAIAEIQEALAAGEQPGAITTWEG